MAPITVENMRGRTGLPIPTQLVLTHKETGTKWFNSYGVTVAKLTPDARTFGGRVQLDHKYWNYSTTTNKYRNQFLDMTTAEIEARIKDGTFTLSDLNN